MCRKSTYIFYEFIYPFFIPFIELHFESCNVDQIWLTFPATRKFSSKSAVVRLAEWKNSLGQIHSNKMGKYKI